MDPTLPIRHAADDAERHIVTWPKIGVDHFLPFCWRHTVQGAIARDTGVVHQYIDRVKISHDLSDARSAGGKVADIGFINWNARVFVKSICRFVITGVNRRN
jgi:hypothetical protein